MKRLIFMFDTMWMLCTMQGLLNTATLFYIYIGQKNQNINPQTYIQKICSAGISKKLMIKIWRDIYNYRLFYHT